MTNPEGVAVDPYGEVYVSNMPNNVIYVYSANGVYQYQLGNIALSAGGGSSSQLNWSAPGVPANATCSLSSDDGGPTFTGLATSGSQGVTPNLTGRTSPVNYTLTCGGSSAVAQVPSACADPVGQGWQPYAHAGLGDPGRGRARHVRRSLRVLRKQHGRRTVQFGYYLHAQRWRQRPG